MIAAKSVKVCSVVGVQTTSFSNHATLKRPLNFQAAGVLFASYKDALAKLLA